MWNMIFLVTGAIFIVMLLTIFFKKKAVNSRENSLFKWILISNVFQYVIEIPLQIMVRTIGVDHAIVDILARSYLVSISLCYTIFTMYVFVICLNKNKSDYNHKINIINIVLALVQIPILILIFKLPITKYYDSSKMFISGQALDLLKLYITCMIGLYIVLLLKNYKDISNKKYIPMYFIIVLMLFMTVLNAIDPSVLVTNMIGTFVCYTMYFTIENPDVKMLQEFKTAKDRAEKANEEKELFLYNITQDIRMPLYDIRKASTWLSDNASEVKEKDIKDGTYYINNKTSNILDKVNNILDLTNMELTNIKVYNKKYSAKNLLRELFKIYSAKVPKGVKLKFNVDSNIPEYLDGDIFRLKQLLTILLDNACKYTNRGLIELNFNTVIKRGVCRLIVTVEDTGCGISASELDEIFSKDNQLYASLDKIDDNKKNLAIAKSITTLLGGILLLESEIGSGTKITLVLDQKIFEDKSNELEKLESDSSKYVDRTKVMVVSEDSEYLASLVKKISKYDVEVEAMDLGAKCLEKIRLNNKYDLIIMDEELTHLSALDILNKLKGIQNFNIDVAILTNNPENRGYISDGFKYVLNRKIKKDELDKLMNGIEK